MIPLIRNTFYNEQETRAALSDFILTTPKLSMGEMCQKFEKDFCSYQGRKESVLYNSGASANLALLQSLKNLGRLKEGDMVGFSALTWATNVMPIIQMGFVPVAIDCDRYSLNVMPAKLLITLNYFKLKALFITNALGFTGNLGEIEKICKQENIILLEDNCEALGTVHFDKKAGNYSLASTFSFFVAHHLSTIEGGMVCTDDEELAEMLIMVRANGWDRNLKMCQQYKLRDRHKIESEFYAKYTFYEQAYNLRPTEITGFLGQYQLPKLKEMVRKRSDNYIRIEESVKNNTELIMLNRALTLVLSSFAIPIICRKKELRDEYLKRFADAEIEVRPMIAGNINTQPFYKPFINDKIDLRETDFLHYCSFYCGNYPEMTDQEIETIISCLH